MATRKIKDAKDLSTQELIYFKGHAKATFMSDGATVEDAVRAVENATYKNKGYFKTLADLQTAYPNGGVGSRAYVGSTYPYSIYLWQNGAWVDSGATGGDESVDLASYYTKSETDTKLTELSDEIVEKEPVTDMTTGVFYDMTGVEFGGEYNGQIGYSSVFSCIKTNVKKGDVYALTTYDNTDSAKAYCVTDSNNKVIQLQTSAVNNARITISKDGLLYVNSWASGNPSMSVAKIENKIDGIATTIQKNQEHNEIQFTELNNEISNVREKVEIKTPITDIVNGQFYNMDNLVVGSTYYGAVGFSVAFCKVVVNVKKGERYVLTTYDNTDSAKAYCVTDLDYKVISIRKEPMVGEVVDIAQDGYMYVNSNILDHPAIQVMRVVNRVDVLFEETKNLYAEVTEFKDAILTDSFIKDVNDFRKKTRIHLFGDSVTHGVGSSDFSATGAQITTGAYRNVGKKSYAALLAEQIQENYSEIGVNIATSPFVKKVNGSSTYDGRFFTTNVADEILVEFEFIGNYFYYSYLPLANGGIFKIKIDGIEKSICDSSIDNGMLIKVDDLADARHNVQFVGTGESNAIAGTSYISFIDLIIPKKIEVINDGVSGYQSRTIANLITQNTTEEDDFVLMMGGLNDRAQGAIGETLSSFVGVYNWAKTERNFEMIFISPNPAENESYPRISNVAQTAFAIRSAAESTGAKFIDCFNYLTKFCVENNKTLSDICADLLHPNDFGHKLIANYILKELGLAANFVE